ncbi:MAG: cutinase protein [Nocardia sp.]|uniref:cutinase family protein n=1 Tax=Nocardia sp. TaxID=1821 RepID=UPI00262A9F55|nr:cutinase family protein [Nocardia sp.]MCU1639964.1 cutinase protein [Nocardia sp.]
MSVKKLIAVAAVTALSGLSGVALGSGSGSAAADPGCPALYVVAIPGTWETGKDKHADGPGMLTGVTDGLPGSAEVAYVDYPATALPWEGDIYGASQKQAVENARAMVGAMAQRCGGTRIALLGYSQGADAAGDLASEIATGQGVVAPDRIAGVGLISDPSRSPSDIQVGPPVGGTGAKGPRVGGFGYVSDRVRTICAQGDLYCSADDQDYVMRFAGYLAQLDGDPAQASRYELEAASTIADVEAHGGIAAVQSQFGNDSSNERARQLATFYATGTHESYGAYQVGGGQTAISWMHNWIAGMA